MNKPLIIFPHQLFEDVFERHNQTVVLFEAPEYFRDERNGVFVHKQKIVLHRASMQVFYRRLQAARHASVYIDYAEAKKTGLQAIFEAADAVTVYDPIDQRLSKQLKQLALETHTQLTMLESPNFLTESTVLDAYFKNKKRYLMADFYAFQRRRLDVLMVGVNPEGGRYSFDTENRQKLPINYVVPAPFEHQEIPEVNEAFTYVKEHFNDHPGTLETFNHPVTRAQARAMLDYFINEQLADFGPYQDALSLKHDSLFHSKLSAPLNIGLLNPREIIAAVLQATVPLASQEGFIRQIIGWREFMRAMYVQKGTYMRTKNYLNQTQPLHLGFYGQGIGLEVIDAVIEKVNRTAYAHHIERLMVLGNFMLLTRTDPDAIHRYFMTMFIDAYDWVMVPNVYGMSQFASGPLLSTKPYFSSANYLQKMGYDQDGSWRALWNALFYLFLRDHRDVINDNARLKVLLQHLDRKDKETMIEYEHLAKPWLNQT